MRIKRSILISFGIALLLMMVGTAVAVEAPAEEWNRTFGGAYNDGAFSVQQLSDGGYIIAGYYSQDSTYAGTDAWLIKNYANGTEEWNRTFGGTLYDRANSVQQTSDGGYIIAGLTRSFGAVETDALLIKTDANGTEEWNRTFGGGAYDGFNSVQQTFNTTGDPDGYIIAGYVDNDAMLIKIYADGTEEWNKRFDSGTLYERAESVQQTADGGYIIAGHTGSTNSDFWLIKTYADGTEEWNKRFDSGVFDNDYAYSVQQTSDGGYIIAGSAGSYDSDFWLIKTYADGTEEWNNKFNSGSNFDRAESVQQTSDGGYIIAGGIYSIATNSNDAWLIKTYANGTEEWNMTFGGTGNDGAYSVQQTSDGGYIIAGFTAANGNDAWLIKIAGAGQGVTTHYVGGGGYSTIQAAVDAAADGDTIIVYPGTYTEDVLVSKELIIESYSGNPEDTIVQAASYSAFWVVANNVTISGFKTVSYYNGIIVEGCNNTILTDNIMEGAYGSYVSSGIVVQGSCNNTILTNNSVMNNVFGIIVQESCNNTILTDNIAEWNYELGILVQSCNNTVLINNVAENNEGGIVLGYSDNCILTDNILNGNYYGMALGFVNNSILTNNIVTNNGDSGIILYMSNNNKLMSNTAANNYFGIQLWSSSNNELTSNTAANNYVGGIQLDSSSNNELKDNTVINNYQGIHMTLSSDNTLTSNMVSGNNYCGIWLEGNNNTVSSNNVSDNVYYGFHMSGNSNLIYNNRFNNSTFDFIMDGDSAGLNTLNSTEMLTYMYNGNIFTSYIGNNYSDYDGVDDNGDGIGDTPRYEDSYPLMFWPVIPLDPIVEPSDAIEELKLSINELELSPGINESINVRLDNVLKQLEKGDEYKAIKKLEDLMLFIGKLPPQTLDPNSANFLIAEAQKIIDMIEL